MLEGASRRGVEATRPDRVVFASTEDEASEYAARFVIDRLRTALAARRDVNLVASVGRSPRALYARLARERDALPWDRVRIFAMDELPGSPFSALLHRTLIGPLGAQRGADLGSRAGAPMVERQLLEEGIDLVVHGVGTNGHLGFCEPEHDPYAPSGEVQLSLSTQRSLSEWIEEVPRVGFTLSRRVLSTARSAVLLAFGAHKAAALEAVLGTHSPSDGVLLPVADLRAHPDLFVACDRAALGRRGS